MIQTLNGAAGTRIFIIQMSFVGVFWAYWLIKKGISCIVLKISDSPTPLVGADLTSTDIS